MFVKFLDDLELEREGEAKLAGKKFKPAIEPPYRWRDWAAQPDGITGDELLAFISNEETWGGIPRLAALAHSGRIHP